MVSEAGRGAVVAVSKSANAPSPRRRAIAATERIVLARTMSQRKYAAQVLNVLEARGAGRSASQHDLDVDAVRHLDPHELPQGAFVRVEVDEPLVDPHLPAVPRLTPFAVRRFAHRHDEPFRREGDRARHRDTGPLADQLDLLAHVVDLLRVRAAQRDPRLLGHASTWREETEGHGVSASRR